MEFKRFFQFLLFLGSYRGLNFENNSGNSAVFFFIFLTKYSSILTKFSSLLLKYVKIVYCSAINFLFKDSGGLLNYSVRVFCLEFLLFFSKIRLFRRKNGFFSPLALNLLEVDTFKLRPYPFYSQKRDSFTPAGFMSLLEL